MNCPKCDNEGSVVRDSRPCESGRAIRRRRKCERCDHKWTTFETTAQPGNREREKTIRRVMQRLTASMATVLMEEIGVPEHDQETESQIIGLQIDGIRAEAL